MIVRCFKKNEESLLLEAIDRLWAKNHVYVRKPELLSYLVYNTPYTEEFAGVENTSFLGIWDENNQIVGLLGYIPQEFNNKGEITYAGTDTIWIADRKSKAPGLLLWDYVMKGNPIALLSIGINDNVKHLYKAIGWNIVEKLSRWCGIVKKKEMQELFFKEKENEILKLLPTLKEENISTMFICENKLDMKKWNKFYFEKFAPKSIGIIRDYKFLKWRYLEYPIFEYKVITLKNDSNEYIGLAIIRVEEISNSYKIGRILEFIVVEEIAAIALANEVIKFDREVIFWDFYCMSNIVSFGLEMVGFRRLPEDEFVIPTRFQPLDLNHMSIKSAIYLDEKLEINPLLDNQIYITKGDADQDRPN